MLLQSFTATRFRVANSGFQCVGATRGAARPSGAWHGASHVRLIVAMVGEPIAIPAFGANVKTQAERM
jgi:hypothetical protein